MLASGDKAPAFSLTADDGRTVRLSELAGRPVVLYFYPKDDTPGCTKEACGFRDLGKKIAQHDAVVLGVSPDGGDSHQKFAHKYKLPFTLLSDPDKKVMKAYGAYGPKMMYGKKTTGVIRSTVWIGPDGKVVKHWSHVPKADEHPDKVLEALQENS
jgi:peroxiredoxin Q/BCP